MSYLGIDIGTSACKVGLLHPDGRFRVHARPRRVLPLGDRHAPWG